MELLPIVELPYEFCQLLKMSVNKNDSSSVQNTLFHYILESESLCSLIELNFDHLKPEGKVPYFLRSLGWINFRNRLASVYFYYMHYKAFPFYTDLQAIEDVVQKELIFEKYNSSGDSRLFLLFYYLKLAKFKDFLEVFPDDLEGILREVVGKRILYIDWILLILWHFYSFMGKKRLFNKLKHNRELFRFSVIMNELGKNDRTLLYCNLLNYGVSIGENELFIKKILA